MYIELLYMKIVLMMLLVCIVLRAFLEDCDPGLCLSLGLHFACPMPGRPGRGPL